MNPHDAECAHRIVEEYARRLEGDTERDFPAPIRLLPYSKPVIKAAILTCASTLASNRQFGPDMRDFLEQAYVALADYVDDDVAELMAEYRQALQRVTDIHSVRDRVGSPGWQQLGETSRLAGEIARTIAEDSAVLRLEFRAGTTFDS